MTNFFIRSSDIRLSYGYNLVDKNTNWYLFYSSLGYLTYFMVTYIIVYIISINGVDYIKYNINTYINTFNSVTASKI